MRYGGLHTQIPVCGWTGTGPAVSCVLSHDSDAAASTNTSAVTAGFTFGNGWTFSYGASVIQSGSDMQVIEGDGQRPPFHPHRRRLGP